MKSKNHTVIDNSNISQCYTCGGVGSIAVNESHPVVRELCHVCKGTGVYKIENYIIVDEVNKIAFDSDLQGK
jgi:DnaJ-class molecular chaperone